MSVLDKHNVEVLILFVPKLGAKEKHVVPAMRYLSGENVHYFWSPDRTVMANFGGSIGYEVELWDYWAIYLPSQLWENESAPAPIFWRHQMPGLPDEKKLDIEEFMHQLASPKELAN